MNYPVIKAEQAQYNVRIAAAPASSNDLKKEKEEDIVWTTEDEESLLLQFAPDTADNFFHIRLNVPAELWQEDVQYVVETSPGGSFPVTGMCEGQRRAAASNWDQSVLLQVNGTAAAAAAQQQQGKEEVVVMVWAGWAIGHEPVTLTHKYVLTAATTTTTTSEEEEEEATEL